MFKKKTSLLLLLLVITIMAVIPLNVYAINNDYIGHWAEDTIQTWLDNNFVTGYPDGSFKPDGSVTRAEFVKMANNFLGYTETTNIKFTDINPDDWFYVEIQKAFKAGYIAGVSETQFAPNNHLTREQAAVIVSKILNLDLNSKNVQVFSDYVLISDWAKDYVNATSEAQLILGYTEDNSFRPQKPITRAEAIVLLDRLNQFEIGDIVVPEGTITPPLTGGGGGGGGNPGPVDPTPPVKISWMDDINPSGNKFVGQVQDIEIKIGLLDDVQLVENVDMIMLWEKQVNSQWEAVEEDDISITCESYSIEMSNGIYQLIKGMTVDKDTTVKAEITFNEVGEYKLTIYCIKEELR